MKRDGEEEVGGLQYWGLIVRERGSVVVFLVGLASEVHKRQEVETETKGPLLGVFGVLKFVAVTHLLIDCVILPWSLGDCCNFAGRQRELIPYRSLGPWLLGGHSHLRRVFAFVLFFSISLSCVVGD